MRAGGDSRRGPTGIDAGGRAGAGEGRRGDRRNGAPATTWRARDRAVSTHARSKCSISVGVADRFPVSGADGPGRELSRGAHGHQRFPDAAQLRARPVQNRFRRSWPAGVDELEVPIQRGRDVTGFAQDDTGVDVELSGGESLRAEYLVGCDGGRSLIRKAAASLPRVGPSVSSLIAGGRDEEEPESVSGRDDKGQARIGPIDDGKRVRLVVSEEHVGQNGEPRWLISAGARGLLGKRTSGCHSPTWISRFTDMTRQAALSFTRRGPRDAVFLGFGGGEPPGRAHPFPHF